jgi:hypothetical protein
MRPEQGLAQAMGRDPLARLEAGSGRAYSTIIFVGFGALMTSFRVVSVGRSKANPEGGWAVERIEPDGLTIMVSRLHATKKAAEHEAFTLNEEVARRTMR